MIVAIVGATGLVGTKMLQVLQERNFPVTELLPVASAASVGKSIRFQDRDWPVISMEDAIARKPHLALFSAGGSVSLNYAPAFVEAGSYVVDNSSAWRMDPKIPLVVPEVNPDHIQAADRLIANPNCSTIQMVVVLKPLHKAFSVKRLIVSTYQSVTGTGQKAVKQLMDERAGRSAEAVYPHPIDLNILPHIDVFQDNGYTREEMKMIHETRKIMDLPGLAITATAVRVPTIGGHSESLNIEFEKPFEIEAVKELLGHSEGIILQDKVSENHYPMPIYSHDKDEVFVGRIRRDESHPNTLNLWVVADNLRKGAATNAVQIAELLLVKGFLRA